MTGFALLLDLTDRPVVVVGGGAVATRRVRSLREAGADVRVVATHAADELVALGVPIDVRPFAAPDLDGAWLVVACTDDREVNAAVMAAAQQRRIFCVRADSAPDGSARIPASLRRDGLTVAVSGGDDPRRAMALRDAISVALDVGELPARPVRPAASGGSVALVGGGPGDPELITVRGRRLVASADVIIVDRLAPRDLLDDLPEDVEVIDCGKSAHRHNLTQDEINATLIERARAGKRVVRLKGGDPFVFGRGGEEFLACVAAGVTVSVVPGISSAVGAPAAAHIPLTHRGVAAEFTVVSGHLDPSRPADDPGRRADDSSRPADDPGRPADDPGRPADAGMDWSGLAASPGTLVLLMAMDRLDLIAGELIGHGRAPSTPAAAIHRATLDGEVVVRAPLDALAKAVREAGIGAPGVVVIGDVVNLLV